MSRLFITPREINFISDITKELIKDCVGQKIYYYSISNNTKSSEVYNESMDKIFDAPVIIDALVDNNFQSETTVDQFGTDSKYKIEVFIQYRDLIEKGIHIHIGDFFSFSDIFYEISDSTVMRNIYGLPEYKDGVKVTGIKARIGQFETKTIGPTDIKYTDEDAVQKTFVQQRGRKENNEGLTGDVRDLVKNGVLEPSIDGQREVSEQGAIDNDVNHGSSFYDE